MEASSAVQPQQPPAIAEQSPKKPVEKKNEMDNIKPEIVQASSQQSQAQSPPKNKLEKLTPMIDNIHRNDTHDDAFFSVDGYGIETGDDSTQEFGGVFSYDEVYAMMGGSNSVTDPNVGDNCHGFIPVGTSDMRQLLMDSSCGMEGSAPTDRELEAAYRSGSGPYYRIISVEGDLPTNFNTTLDESSSSTTNSGSSCPVAEGTNFSTTTGGSSFGGNAANNGEDVLASPAGGATLESVGGQQKVRKPRGRKPKHVKEAEAAAAAALTTGNGTNGNSGEVNQNSSSPSRQSNNVLSSGLDTKRAIFREPADGIIPNVTVVPQKLGVATVDTSTSPLSHESQRQKQQSGDNHGSFQQQHRRHVHLPSSLSSAQMATMEQLAHHDRRVILTARRHHPYMKGSSSPPRNGHLSTASHYAHAGHVPGGRLDQFFSSRISAPSNSNIVKPRLIQENKSIYKLLTTPTAPRPGAPVSAFDNRKLSQERWMQTPNPSISADDGFGGNSSAGNSSQGVHLTLDPRADPSKQNYYQQQQQQQHAASSSAPPHRYIIGPNYQGRVNIRRDGNAFHGGRGATGGSAPYGMDRSGQYHFAPQQTHQSFPSSSAPHPMNIGSSGFSQYNNHVYELQYRLEHLAQDNFELRCRVSYLHKAKKQLYYRLKQAYEQNEDLKMYILQNSQLSPNDQDDAFMKMRDREAAMRGMRNENLPTPQLSPSRASTSNSPI